MAFETIDHSTRIIEFDVHIDFQDYPSFQTKSKSSVSLLVSWEVHSVGPSVPNPLIAILSRNLTQV